MRCAIPDILAEACALPVIPFPVPSQPFSTEPSSAKVQTANLACLPGKDLESVARRRFQNPKPKKIGNWWWIYPWVDTWSDGKILRKRKPIKVAPAETGVREAQRIASEMMRPMNQGTQPIGGVVPFRVFVESDYRNAVLPLLAAPVQKNYNLVLRTRLLPEFGDVPLRDLTKRRLQTYFSTLEGSHATAAKIRDVLASVLNAAVRFDLLSSSPLKDVSLLPDKVGRRKKPYVKKEQFLQLVDAMEEPYATMVYTCVLAALRVSELLGLKWGDVGDSYLMIDERYCRGDWSKPKTQASNAPVAVDPDVIQRIRDLKNKEVTIPWGARGASKTIKLVRSSNPEDLVFQGLRSGQPMSDHNILMRHLKPVAKKLGLDLVNWQVLRRSYPTWLCRDGVDVKTVQGQMRHSTSKPTLDIYAQLVTEGQVLAANNLMQDLNRRRAGLSTEKRVPNAVQLEHELEHKTQNDLSRAS
jgi:integrase